MLSSPRTFHPRLAIGVLPLLFITLFAAIGSLHAQGVEAFNRGDTEGAKQKLRLALQVDPNFRPASALLARMAAERAQAGAVAPGLSARALERMVVPVEFSNTTLNSALEFIRQKAAEQSGGKLQINFALNLPPEYLSKRITLKMDHVPVMEVLRYMGDQAGVQFEKQPYAIAVTPVGDKPTGINSTATPLPSPNS